MKKSLKNSDEESEKKESQVKLDLDDWQKKVLETEGNIVLRSGRQVGKSTVVSIKAAEYATHNKNKTILIVASVERQAQLLFEKTLAYLFDNYKSWIMKGNKKPTKHIITLNNGSKIYCLPTGLSGYGIRGYTVDLLIADEAAFIPEDVWTAITPMLAVTRGNIILLSTPFGKGGFFYRCFNDKTFTSFHISSEDCPRKNTEFLQQEKKRMTMAQYAQEYLGEFIDELRQFFPTELIQSCMIAPREFDSFLLPRSNTFLGVDVARMGSDDTVLSGLIRRRDNHLIMCCCDIFSKMNLTEITKLILESDLKFKYRKIYIDDGGLGVGVFDNLLDKEQTRRKVIPINNSARALDYEDKRLKKLLKEDLYNNLLTLMEQHKIELFDDPEIMLSLKSVQYEYDDGKLKIFGAYTHIAEALIRAAWCVKDKSLNIWIA